MKPEKIQTAATNSDSSNQVIKDSGKKSIESSIQSRYESDCEMFEGLITSDEFYHSRTRPHKGLY